MSQDPKSMPDIPPPPGTTILPDIPYGEHERQQVDLYLPQGQIRGVVAYIHGGSWAKRDRKIVRAWYLLERGYAVASLGYRLSQHQVFPAQIQDVNAALGLLCRIAPEHGLDMKRLALLGLSAGGHLAALAALATAQTDFGADPAVKIRAVVDYYGPSNLITLCAGRDNLLSAPVTQLLGQTVFDAPQVAWHASPVAHCNADSPPFLLIHGDADSVVPITESYNFQAQLQARGGTAQMIHVPGGGHATPHMHTPQINAQIADFIDLHLAG
ncbi:acetyl esterase (plasmid) [Sulfitobacter sp. THAF37]|uniref:alpha/beta hydrolase n=1 Tax=Sulfitobacter sp. THAF37 TaxID=2587855 RepID=UPI0012AAAC6B|nr:alpha/beta hydrolase [Sulfitobacter sp. THAF37]QFT61058.1 acetyl esterase [Sulfitobacter sp. THAF37]